MAEERLRHLWGYLLILWTFLSCVYFKNWVVFRTLSIIYDEALFQIWLTGKSYQLFSQESSFVDARLGSKDTFVKVCQIHCMRRNDLNFIGKVKQVEIYLGGKTSGTHYNMSIWKSHSWPPLITMQKNFCNNTGKLMKMFKKRFLFSNNLTTIIHHPSHQSSQTT